VEVVCPFDNLQDAMDHAQPGTTIEVFGTCTGHFTIKVNDLTLEHDGILDGGGNGTVLTVNAGVSADVNNLTIQNGFAPTPAGGGGVVNNGTLNLRFLTVRDNKALGLSANGGGIYNSGELNLTRSAVTGNLSLGGGGGIYNKGTANLVQTPVTDNSTDALSASGGGVLNDGTLKLTLTSVSGNTSESRGGGIFNNGTVSGVASSVTDNHPDNCAGPNSVPGCSG
jgi:hypothetical protein